MSELMQKNPTRGVVAAFEILKNVFSADEAARYIISLGFLRWLTELKYHTDSQEHLVILESSETGSKIKLVLPPEIEYQMLMIDLGANNLGEKLNRAFAELEYANIVELDGVFDGLDFSNRRFSRYEEKYALLRDTMIQIANIELRNGDKLHNLVELSIQIASEHLISGFYAPEFNTPLSICRVIADIVHTVNGESIYDPVCGSSQLLMVCAKSVDEGMPSRLAAHELNHTAWALAKMNLISHGFSSRALLQGNSLDSHSVHLDGGQLAKFDVIVGHPPWSARFSNQQDFIKDKYRRFDLGLPPKNNADYAFILHMVSSMKPDSGRMAVVISNGALTRGGAEREIRKTLIERNLVDAVIGLPEKIFQGTPIPGAILVLKADRKFKDILFIDSRSLADIGRGKSVLPEKAIGQISYIYKNRASRPRISTCVDRHLVQHNDYSLSIPLYVSPIPEEKTRPLEIIQAERRATETVLEKLNLHIDRLMQDLC